MAGWPEVGVEPGPEVGSVPEIEAEPVVVVGSAIEAEPVVEAAVEPGVVVVAVTGD